jgi:hypothetical protein
MAMNSTEANLAALLDRVDFDFVGSASYFSNLDPQRHSLYLRGADSPDVSGSLPKIKPFPGILTASFSARIPHALGFVERSLRWGGGRAVVSTAYETRSTRHAFARIELMPRRQYEHITGQENALAEHWKTSTSPLPLPIRELTEQALREGKLHTTTGYDSTYNTLLFLGLASHPAERRKRNATLYPVFTFTREKQLVGADDLNAPSKAYVERFARGMRRSFPAMTPRHIADYLSKTEGIDAALDSPETWTHQSIEAFAADVFAAVDQSPLMNLDIRDLDPDLPPSAISLTSGALHEPTFCPRPLGFAVHEWDAAHAIQVAPQRSLT